jgi:hypothetical protein
MTHSALANSEQKAKVVVGNMKMWIGTITITSYTKNASGEALVASDFGMVKIIDVIAQPFIKSAAVGPILPMWNGTKLRLWCSSVTNSELADAAVIPTIYLRVFGK